MKRKLNNERKIYSDVQIAISKAIQDIGVKNLYEVNLNDRHLLLYCIKKNNEHNILPSTLVKVQPSEINPVQKIIVKDLMDSISNDIKKNITNNIIISDITYKEDEDMKVIVKDIENKYCDLNDEYLLNKKSQIGLDMYSLYFVSKGFEKFDYSIAKSFYSRVHISSIHITINQENINLLFDTVYKELDIEFTDFEKSLIFNSVKDDIEKMPEIICELINKNYSNINLADFNELQEKAHKYDELMMNSDGCMPK